MSDIPAPSSGEQTWKKAARILFLLAALGAAGWLISSEWAAIIAALSKADPSLIGLAILAAITNVVLTGVSWRTLLTEAPVKLSLKESARIFFVGQIGKYFPGTVWSFLASGELAKQAGFPRAAAMSSLLLALLIGVGIGALIAVIAVPQALGFGLPIIPMAIGLALLILFGLHPRVRSFALGLARIDFPVSLTSLSASGLTALLAWIVAGAQVLLLSQAVGVELPWNALPQITGAYAFAWVAGFAVVIAPAGLGAREGGLLAVLSLTMGLAEASAVVLLSRLVVTIADFACAGAAMLIAEPKASLSTSPPPHQG